jgi:hypothetical protein
MDENSLILAVEAAVTAFTAFCIWLGVRIFNRRERWAKRTAFVLALALVFYTFSMGPVYRLRCSYTGDPPVWLAYTIVVYCAPFDVAFELGPEWVRTLIGGYVRWWMPRQFPWS